MSLNKHSARSSPTRSVTLRKRARHGRGLCRRRRCRGGEASSARRLDNGTRGGTLRFKMLETMDGTAPTRRAGSDRGRTS
jgi:hypothetical protein